MKINIICEVNAALFDLVHNRDASLHSKVLANLAQSLQPEGVELASYSKEVSSKKLICFFGEEDLTIEAVTQLDADFPPPTFIELAAFWENGYQYTTGLGLDIKYPIDMTGEVPEMFKYAYDVPLTFDTDGFPLTWQSYSDYFLSLTPGQRLTKDPFWRTTDFSKRIYV